MKKRGQRVFASMVVTLLTSVTGTASARAAGDVTPPVITTNANAGFVVGSVIGLPDYSDDLDFGPYVGVEEYINWKVTDNSGGICDFKVNTITGDGYETLVSEPVQGYQATPYAGQFIGWNDTYSGQIGDSEDAQYGWTLEASDCGNATKVQVPSKPTVLEENNYTVSSGAGHVTYSGSWSNVSCACASGGLMKKTTAKGASFTFTNYYNRDDHFGLVMAKSPARGSADVYVDGKKVATVNTYSATTQNRTIVYDRWMPEGNHTVKVVNLATSGHPRIDLDAILGNNGW